MRMLSIHGVEQGLGQVPIAARIRSLRSTWQGFSWGSTAATILGQNAALQTQRRLLLMQHHCLAGHAMAW